jgi:hypothetical protein
MRIFKFKDFLNESRGLATPVIPYTDFIESLSFLALEKFLKNKQNTLSEVPSEITENISIRKDYVKSDFPISESEWEKLPISSMDLKIEIKNMTSEEFDENSFYTTGFCFNMDEKDGSYLKDDGSIHLRIEIAAEINKSYTEENSDDLKTELRSTILHELNHAYEGYKRKIKGYPSIQDAITMASDHNTENVPEEVWNYWWKELGYAIYFSEIQEMNAMVHDSIPWTSKFPVEEMKKKNNAWDKAISMIEFNADEFKENMIELIQSNTEDDPITLMTKMKDGFANKIEQIAKERGEDDPSLSPDKIKKMSIDRFINYLEKRINTRGEVLRRKILRTYSL